MKFHKINRNFTESLKSPIYQIPARANETNLYLWISWNQYNTVRQTNYDSGKWKRIRQKPYYWLSRCLFGNFCLMSNPLPSHHSPCYSSCGTKFIISLQMIFQYQVIFIHPYPKKQVSLTRLLGTKIYCLNN